MWNRFAIFSLSSSKNQITFIEENSKMVVVGFHQYYNARRVSALQLGWIRVFYFTVNVNRYRVIIRKSRKEDFLFDCGRRNAHRQVTLFSLGTKSLYWQIRYVLLQISTLIQENWSTEESQAGISVSSVCSADF